MHTAVEERSMSWFCNTIKDKTVKLNTKLPNAHIVFCMYQGIMGQHAMVLTHVCNNFPFPLNFAAKEKYIHIQNQKFKKKKISEQECFAGSKKRCKASTDLILNGGLQAGMANCLGCWLW
ncbi:hypothetical protein Tsubulata_047262 [Turnera subulata]|uniref:Uncharacterized protein n=1 Tax=Turnera subulata TaxID=218843 RepID=A0A9Q0J7M9_9ROSI|nr:hypothetical protein Tsubulata_047262 [Turnera subulata]